MEEKNRLYDQFDTKKIDEFTSFNLDSFRDQIFIEESNEKISNDLIRTGILSNQLSSSGPMPGTCKTITLTTSTDGSYVELFRPSEGEVYQIMSAHMAKSGAGTTIHSISYYDGSSDSQWFYLSSGSTDNILTSDDNWPTHSLFVDNNNYFRYKGQNNFSSVTIQLVVIRVR